MCCHAWGPLDRQHIPAPCSSTSLGYSSMFSSPPHKFTSHKVSKPLTHMWAPPLPSLQHMYSLPKKTHSTFLRQNDTHLPRSQIPSMFSGMESLQSASCDETRAPQNRYKLFESGTTKVFVPCLFADMLWRCQVQILRCWRTCTKMAHSKQLYHGGIKRCQKKCPRLLGYGSALSPTDEPFWLRPGNYQPAPSGLHTALSERSADAKHVRRAHIRKLSNGLRKQRLKCS